MLYEAMLQLGDNAGALKALKIYRSIDIPKRPDQEQPRNDQLAMVNYIDLSARQLETAEQRFDFYKSILDSRAPDPVKSHAALRASQVAHERGEADLQDSFLGQALRLNPVNLDALRARLEALGDNGTAVERIGVLLSMLKSNPVQAPVTYRIAREIADAGLPEESLAYYAPSAELASRTGAPLGREFWLLYASELYLTGKPQLLVGARTITEQLIKQDAADVDALLLRWLAERVGGDKDVLTKIQQQLLNATLNHVLVLRQQIGVTGAGATTRPVDSPDVIAAPDLADDVNKLKDDKIDALRVPYAQAVSDLAWYMVYVANQPAEAAKLLPALKAVLSDKDPLVVRIEGWIFLAQGQFDQAGVKLKAVADQDVLAQAGTLLLWAKNPAEKDPAMSSARKLLQEHPSGLLAVMLMDALRDLNVKLLPRADADAVKERLTEFKKDWFRIIDAPQNFYVLNAGMADAKVIFAYGEPMFARVTIKNISPYDITIGPEGAIRNDLWFDAQLRGIFQQVITGAAYERLSNVLVLKPNQTVTQTLRLDQGQLYDVLARNPNPAITFYGHVRTNPRGDGNSSPAGYDVQFNAITERTGFGLSQNSMNALTATVAGGKRDEKIRGMELIAGEASQFRSVPEQTDQTRAIVIALLDTLQKSTSDPDPAVATWSTFLTAVQNPPKRQAIIQALLTEPDPTRQMLGLLIANLQTPEQQKQWATTALAANSNDMVKLYANGMIEMVELLARQPTTAPADAGGAPATGTPTPLVNPVGSGEPPKQP
jgi:tetratricopeptide (TPR) repeat protein